MSSTLALDAEARAAPDVSHRGDRYPVRPLAAASQMCSAGDVDHLQTY